MDKESNLISIGEMAKISGINIKCLRYYDAEGVLIPAWINPDTGYRYYDISQTAILEVIECCLALDIPLKVIKGFLDLGNNKDAMIKTERMCNHGIEVLKERVNKITQLQKRMEHLQEEMLRGENVFESDQPVKVRMRSFSQEIRLFEGNIDYKNMRMLVADMLKDARKRGLKVTYNFGVLFLRIENTWKQHLYVDLWMDKEEAKKLPQIMTIEEGEYLCITLNDFESNAVLEECVKYVEEDEIELIEVSELFKGENKYPNPDYEIRIKLKE